MYCSLYFYPKSFLKDIEYKSLGKIDEFYKGEQTNEVGNVCYVSEFTCREVLWRWAEKLGFYLYSYYSSGYTKASFYTSHPQSEIHCVFNQKINEENLLYVDKIDTAIKWFNGFPSNIRYTYTKNKLTIQIPIQQFLFTPTIGVYISHLVEEGVDNPIIRYNKQLLDKMSYKTISVLRLLKNKHILMQCNGLYSFFNFVVGNSTTILQDVLANKELAEVFEHGTPVYVHTNTSNLTALEEFYKKIDRIE